MKGTTSPVTPRRKRRLEARPVQLGLFKKRGGKRRGAGRPPKGARAGAPHKARPALAARYPVHVVLRVAAAVGNLRRRCVYRAIREATLTAGRFGKIRIVQLSIQRTHVHLLVEANGKDALAKGMQGFQISAASTSMRRSARAGRGRAGGAPCSPTAITHRSSRRRGRRGTLCRM